MAKGSLPHLQDSDCTVDPDTGCCSVCGVSFGSPCSDCGGKGFHKFDCSTNPSLISGLLAIGETVSQRTDDLAYRAYCESCGVPTDQMDEAIHLVRSHGMEVTR